MNTEQRQLRSRTNSKIPRATQTRRSKSMPAIRRTTLTEIMWKLHRFVNRASGGRAQR
jgi:hypothetical protein